jgi:hypothetical protein
MQRIRCIAAAAAVLLCVLAVCSPAAAWEFKMTGAFYWNFEMWSQAGGQGFFGPYDVDAGSGVAGTGVGFFAPYNFWLGSPDVGTQTIPTRRNEIVSGSDASWDTIYMLTDMDIRLNPAIRVRGTYRIGSWHPTDTTYAFGQGALVRSEYLNQMFSGIQRAISPGYWNTLWLTVELPWGVLAVGKRPSVWGMGLSWNGTESRSLESFSLCAPAGPFRFAFAIYPSRRGDTGTRYYNRDVDKNNTRLWDSTVPQVTYRSGPVDMGFLLNPVGSHSGGEGVVNTPATRQTTAFRADRQEFYGDAYFKYYNGMFFFNSEVTFYQQTDRTRQKTGAGAPVRGVRDVYVEHWRYAVELSTLSGPARVALMHAWLQGDDRRGGQFVAAAQAINNVTYIDKGGTVQSSTFSNTGLFEPYGYLLTNLYGTGLFINPDTNNGFIEDAVLYGARVDYSVAANLNVFGTFLWAERQSKSGWGWGCISPDTARTDGSVIRRGVFGTSFPGGVADRVGAPNIPDTGLGWEVDLGSNWKLLENLNVKATFAYWKPGDWFKWACIDKSVPNWNVAGPVGSTNPADWGIYPDRHIDPIWGVNVSLIGDF